MPDRKDKIEKELESYGYEEFYDNHLRVPNNPKETNNGKFYYCYSGSHDNNDDSTPNLHVNIDNGVYDCKACTVNGNVWTFIEDHPSISVSQGNKLYWMEDFLQIGHPKRKRSGAPKIPYSLDAMNKLDEAGEELANKLAIEESLIKWFEIKKIKSPQGETIYIFPNFGPGDRVYSYKLMTETLGSKFFSNDPDDTDKDLDRVYPNHIYESADEHEIEELWVVEGEKDVITLADEGVPALTGPSGVNTSASETMADKVKELNPDRVVIAFDKQDGNDHVEKQAYELRESLIDFKVEKVSWPDERDDGWDVRDEVLDNGIEGLNSLREPFPIDKDAFPDLPDWKDIDGNRLYENNGEIWQHNGSNNPDKRVASFTIRAKEIIEQVDEEEPDVYKTAIKSPSGTKIERDISTADLKSVSEFRDKNKEHWARWHGGMKNLLELQEQLSSHARKKKTGVNKYGYWKDYNIFVFNDRIINSDGVNEDSDYTLSMPKPGLWKEALIQEKEMASDKLLDFVGDRLYISHDRKFVYPGICFWGVSWLRTWFIDKLAGFPIFNVHGESGCGKTEWIAHIICPLHSINMYKLPTAESTKFGLTSTFSSGYGTVFPIDEIKSDLKNSKIDWLQRMIRNSYDGKMEGKGNVKGDQLMVDMYEYHTSLASIGEMSLLTDKSMWDRTIPVTLSREFLRSDEGTRASKAFSELKGKPLARICNNYLQFLCRKRENGELDKLWDYTDELVKEDIANRKYRNLRILGMGGVLWEYFCDEVGMKCPNDLAKKAIECTREEYNENYSNALGRPLNEVDYFMSDLSTMAMQIELEKGKHFYRHDEKDQVWINVKSCYQQWRDWVRNMEGETASLDYNSLLGMIRNEAGKNNTYIIEHGKVCNWGGTSVRSTVLDKDFIEEKEELDMMGFLTNQSGGFGEDSGFEYDDDEDIF